MTVEQVLNMIDPQRLMILGNLAVVVNTRDQEEAAYWSAQGSNVRPWYAENAVRVHGRPRQAGLGDQPARSLRAGGRDESFTGEKTDRTRETLLNEARRRTGAGRVSYDLHAKTTSRRSAPNSPPSAPARNSSPTPSPPPPMSWRSWWG